jgi:hypothetical protein
MRLFGEFRGPGVGDPDLEGAQSLITQSNSVLGDSLPHVTVSHELNARCNWRVEGPTGEGHYLLSDETTTQQVNRRLISRRCPIGHCVDVASEKWTREMRNVGFVQQRLVDRFPIERQREQEDCGGPPRGTPTP